MTLKTLEQLETTTDYLQRNKPMLQEAIEKYKKQIDSFSQIEMCRIHRFSMPGQYPWFDLCNPELVEYWNARFKALGGFTPEISKQIGW